MSEPFVFDPRHELCKQPYGAVISGTKVKLHVRPLTRERFTGCTLMLLEEFSGQRREYPLTIGAAEGDRTRFDLEFTAPAQPELVWYHFRLTKPMAPSPFWTAPAIIPTAMPVMCGR